MQYSCLEGLKHYWYSEKFELFDDPKSLKYLFSQNELNVIQRSWIEVIKDYDFLLQYLSGTTKEVTNALNLKVTRRVVFVMIQEWLKLETVFEFDLILLGVVCYMRFS